MKTFRFDGRRVVMTGKTFPALVAEGQLRFHESLADMEGQRVLVTVAPTSDRESTEPLPPDWLDVEQDVVFRMPFRWETVHSHAVDGAPLRPSVILPEDLPDE